MCGGTVINLARKLAEEGLSPRVRGNLSGDQLVRPGMGSIPACAGEPPTSQRSMTAARVYPRVCGGTSRTVSPGSVNSGLSPRVRGNRLPADRRSDPGGSIPACAGEPYTQGSAHLKKAVYPRVCGGTMRPSRLSA